MKNGFFSIYWVALLAFLVLPFRVHGEIPDSELQALTAIYNATDGDSWNKNTHWLSGDPSTWYGVQTNPEKTTVRILYLYHNGLNGILPPEIETLVNLEVLLLYGNQLTGAIPPQLGNLKNLENLNLSGNPLGGSIPPELGNLDRLARLLLSSTQLSGPIPPELGNLSFLRFLFLESNALEGVVTDALSKLSELRILSLSENQLTGAIPPNLGNLAELEHLLLDQNRLEGSIPAELGNLTNLTTLDLSHNQLSGELPVTLSNLEKLTDRYGLNLCGNRLSAVTPEIRVFIEAKHPGGLAAFEACQDVPASPSPRPAEGIWKSEDGAIRFTVQNYQAGSSTVVVLSHGILTPFLDEDVENGISVSGDLLNHPCELGLVLTDSSHGFLRMDLYPPYPSPILPVRLEYPSSSVSDPTIPLHGIWRTDDGAVNLLLQRYETGSCVVIILAAGELFAFLDADCRDMIASDEDIFGNPYSVHMEPWAAGIAALAIDIPGLSGTYEVVLSHN